MHLGVGTGEIVDGVGGVLVCRTEVQYRLIVRLFTSCLPGLIGSCIHAVSELAGCHVGNGLEATLVAPKILELDSCIAFVLPKAIPLLVS